MVIDSWPAGRNGIYAKFQGVISILMLLMSGLSIYNVIVELDRLDYGLTQPTEILTVVWWVAFWFFIAASGVMLLQSAIVAYKYNKQIKIRIIPKSEYMASGKLASEVVIFTTTNSIVVCSEEDAKAYGKCNLIFNRKVSRFI